MAFWSTCPRSITTVGLPHTSCRNRPLFSISTDTSSSQATRAAMGARPTHRGFSSSWMGSTASSESSSVTTSSEFCSWLTWRLPISRTASKITPYISTVRSRITAIGSLLLKRLSVCSFPGDSLAPLWEVPSQRPAMRSLYKTTSRRPLWRRCPPKEGGGGKQPAAPRSTWAASPKTAARRQP